MSPDQHLIGSEPISGLLLDNLVLFGRLLRLLGFDVSSSRMITIVQALEHINIGHRDDFYFALASLLISNQGEMRLFDYAFALFWRKHSAIRMGIGFPRNNRSLIHDSQLAAISSKSISTPESLSNKQSEEPEDEIPALATKTYSQSELLRRKDFAEMNDEEARAVVHRLSELIWRLGLRRTKRNQVGKGTILDFRRSLRNSLRYGGELLILSSRRPKRKPRPLVIIADISGSMEQYTRMLLHFAYLLSRGYERSMEAFVFGTRLTRITRQLKNRWENQALRDVSDGVQDWSGGTRIGESLKSFNYLWARRLLNRGAVVLVISDGWDRGEPELLQKEMARLQRSCHRLIWLNPLLGAPDYEPLTRGMQAALPFVDDFMPIHNLASLEDLANHLAEISERPSIRHKHGLRFSTFTSSNADFRNAGNA
jgi:uncharacterized protein with von Willebrand factor type A (vWA) domain